MRRGNPDYKHIRPIILPLILLTWMLIPAACSPPNPGPVDLPTAPAGYTIDPAFREIYNMRGGGDLLGGAISPPVDQKGSKYQFTTNALWVYDPSLPVGQGIHLAPLGVKIIPPEYQDPPLPPPAQPDPSYVDGQYIYEEFRSLYDRVGGAAVVGKPLTGLRYDAQNNRYEQYFENLGFYVDASGSGPAGLLAYGAFVCESQCYPPSLISGALLHSPPVNPPFRQIVERVGYSLTGSALTDAYTMPDGRREQVFTNLVLGTDPSDPGNPNKVTLRPITEKLSFLPAPPEGPNGKNFFYDLGDGKGYNIPDFFKSYVDAHGGFELTGSPIGEISATEGGIQRQCFSNLCLDYDPAAPLPLRVRPAPLGMQYLQTNPRASATPSALSQNFQHLTAQVWETYDHVASNQEQEIWTSVFLNGEPIANIRPQLVVYMPDGHQVTYDMPPTGTDGRSSFTLPSIVAPNATLIPYDLCVPDGGKMFCYRKEYLILNTP